MLVYEHGPAGSLGEVHNAYGGARADRRAGSSALPPMSDRRTTVASVALCFTMASAGILPFLVGALSPTLLAEFELSRSQLGALTSAFYLTAASVSGLSGRIAERTSYATQFMLLIGSSIAGLVVFAGAWEYSVLIVGAVLGGVSLSLANPTTNYFVSRDIPPRAVGLVIGLKQSGVQMGALAAGAVAPVMGVAFGWRFGILGMLVLPLLAGCLLLLVSQLPRVGVVSSSVPTSRPAPLRASPEARRSLVMLALYGGLFGSGLSCLITYLPLYAVEVVDLGPAQAARVLAVSGVSGIFARVAWGMVAGRSASTIRLLVILAALSCLSVLAIIGSQSAPWLLWFGAVGLGVSAFSWMAVGMVAAVRDVSSNGAGKSAGVISLCFYGGFVAAAPAFGELVDLTGGYWIGWTIVLMFFAAGGLLVASWQRLTGRPTDSVPASHRSSLPLLLQKDRDS